MSQRSERGTGPFPLAAKTQLAVRMWLAFARVRLGVRREPLPLFVGRLARPPRRAARRHPPDRLRRAVDRGLRIGRARPRCLTSALVLFRLLREQGDPAEIVIGLLPEAVTQEAHAWVELDGVDLGPAPGRGQHVELARYGS